MPAVDGRAGGTVGWPQGGGEPVRVVSRSGAGNVAGRLFCDARSDFQADAESRTGNVGRYWTHVMMMMMGVMM